MLSVQVAACSQSKQRSAGASCPRLRRPVAREPTNPLGGAKMERIDLVETLDALRAELATAVERAAGQAIEFPVVDVPAVVGGNALEGLTSSCDTRLPPQPSGFERLLPVELNYQVDHLAIPERPDGEHRHLDGDAALPPCGGLVSLDKVPVTSYLSELLTDQPVVLPLREEFAHEYLHPLRAVDDDPLARIRHEGFEDDVGVKQRHRATKLAPCPLGVDAAHNLDVLLRHRLLPQPLFEAGPVVNQHVDLTILSARPVVE